MKENIKDNTIQQGSNRLFDLPQPILSLIYEFDGTYHDIYKKIVCEIDLFPIWNVDYIKNENRLKRLPVYYCRKIATDMLCHWNNHYTSFIDSLLNYQNNEYVEHRILINYLDTNNIGSEIPGRRETVFEWIKYYNKIITR